MKNITNSILTLIISSLFTVAFAGGGESGINCEPKEQTAEQKKLIEQHTQVVFERVAALKRDLESRGAKAAIISRAGPRPNEFRLNGRPFRNYSYGHAGIAAKIAGKWRFHHLLYDGCLNNKKGGPKLVVEKFFEFWPSDIAFYDLSIKIPSAELQDKIVEVVSSEDRKHSVFNNKYNAVANPFNSKYQNSNGWVISIITAAQFGSQTFVQSQRDFKNNGYVPLQTKLTAKERLGITIGAKPKNVKFDDKPRNWNKRKFFDFYSAESIERYLETIDPMSSETYELSPAEGRQIKAEDLRAERN